MPTTSSSLLLPSLHSITMIDWLPKLGEKAFLAWLRLHSWKKEHGFSPFRIPLSLNRIIKRLQVGNSTFYEHILRPLWNYGLIDLIGTSSKKRELILFSFPMNNPEKATCPLLPLRDYDLDFIPLQEPSFLVDERITSEAAKEEAPVQTTASTNLPQEVMEAIETDPELRERVDAIAEVYTKCQQDPRHSNTIFLRKAKTCIRYEHDRKRFAAYLYKSILNEWNQSPTPRPINKSPTKRPSDVPEWIWRQQQHPTPQAVHSLTPEQQAISAYLLQALGETS